MTHAARTFDLTRRQALALLGVLGVALVARVWWLVTHVPGNLGGTHDELGYATMARQFIARGVFGYYSTSPNAYTTPGYPLFVTGVFKLADVFGASPAAELATLRVAQMLLGVLVVWFAFELGRRLFDARVGLLAAAVAAIYPSSLTAQGRILTEALFTALLLGCLLVAVVVRQRRSWQWHVLLGTLLAVLVLVRPTAALLGVVFYAIDLAETRDWRFAMSSLVALLAFCLVMSPWWVRNRIVLHETVVLSSEGGDPFLRGTDPWDTYDLIGPSIVAGVAPGDMARVGLARLKAGLREHPAEYIEWYTVGKWWYMWGTPWYQTWGSEIVHWSFVLLLGWIGVIAGLFDRRARLLAWTVLVTTLVQLAFIPLTRYMYPLAPVTMVLAAWILVAGWDRWRLSAV
jgi:4-amino-4-deoxy-L-arabinose transferase-like glycosyltransferase